MCELNVHNGVIKTYAEGEIYLTMKKKINTHAREVIIDELDDR